MEVIFWIVMFILISPLIVLGAIDGGSSKKMEIVREKLKRMKKLEPLLDGVNLIKEAPPGCNYFLFLPTYLKYDLLDRYASYDQDIIKDTVVKRCNELMTTFRNRRMSPVPLTINDLNSEERDELRREVISSFYSGLYKAKHYFDDIREEDEEELEDEEDIDGLGLSKSSEFDYGKHIRQIWIASYLLGR